MMYSSKQQKSKTILHTVYIRNSYHLENKFKFTRAGKTLNVSSKFVLLLDIEISFYDMIFNYFIFIFYLLLASLNIVQY